MYAALTLSFLGGARWGAELARSPDAPNLWRMVAGMKNYRDAAIFLGARMFYVDGMTAVLIYTGIYATGVMKWGALEMLIYGIVLSTLAVLGGFVGCWLDEGFGPKRAVQIEIGMSLLGIIAFIGMGPNQILYFWPYDAAAHSPVWGGPRGVSHAEIPLDVCGCGGPASGLAGAE